MSSVVLARMIAVSQKAAWKIGHAIRQRMREDYGKNALHVGIVEVGETSISGAPKYQKGKKNKRGKGTNKTPVMLAVARGAWRGSQSRSAFGDKEFGFRALDHGLACLGFDADDRW
jgi:hypothetical protein